MTRVARFVLASQMSGEVCHAVAAKPRRRTSILFGKACTQFANCRVIAVRSLHANRMMASAQCFVYILESLGESGRHYTGVSSDVAARLAWHNAGLSHHTAKHRPWKVLVSIEFVDFDRANRFEKYLKSGSGRAFAKRHFS